MSKVLSYKTENTVCELGNCRKCQGDDKEEFIRKMRNNLQDIVQPLKHFRMKNQQEGKDY